VAAVLLITKRFSAAAPVTTGFEIVKRIIASVWRSKTSHPEVRRRRATAAIVSRNAFGAR